MLPLPLLGLLWPVRGANCRPVLSDGQHGRVPGGAAAAVPLQHQRRCLLRGIVSGAAGGGAAPNRCLHRPQLRRGLQPPDLRAMHQRLGAHRHRLHELCGEDAGLADVGRGGRGLCRLYLHLEEHPHLARPAEERGRRRLQAARCDNAAPSVFPPACLLFWPSFVPGIN